MNIPLDKTSIAQNKAALEALSDGVDVLQLSETGNGHFFFVGNLSIAP
jgi:hypothetical protein